MGDQSGEGAAAPDDDEPSGAPGDQRRPAISDLKRLLIAHDLAVEAGAETGVALEGTISDDDPLPSSNTVLDRLNVRIAIEREQGAAQSDEIASAIDAARDTLMRYAAPALRKLESGEDELTDDERGALEAVIVTDGTRPSFLLCNGRPDLDDPTMGAWLAMTTAHRDNIERIANAVGRIQPEHGSAAKYFGTGSLVDAAKGLVLTNFHVIADAKSRGVAMSQNDRTITIEGKLEIDFIGEACSLKTNRYRIVSIDLPEDYGAGFGSTDAAVARIESLPDSGPLPKPVPLLSSYPAYAQGAMSSLATIGFPGQPPVQDGVVNGVDWGMITRTLFRNIFGCKRIAPGTFTSPLGTRADDRKKTAFGHNATTFGGASGSLISAWGDTDAPCFGLHFFGATGKENNALAFAAVPDPLRAIGVPIA